MALRLERARLQAAGLAANTRRAYGFDWADFTSWCESAGRASLPATADTVSLYVVALARAGRLVATMERRCAAIAHYHLAAGMPSPITADVREVLYGLRRKLGCAPQHAKAALSVEELQAMLAATAKDARGVRDRALLLLGFAGGLRRSELSGLDVADVRVVEEGLEVRLRRSKTDQEGRGRELGVHRGRRKATCPVRALEAWMVERGRWAGPVFAVVERPSGRLTRRRLSPQGCAAVVKAAAKAAGLDPARYAGHSLRAGLATVAAEHGASEKAIMARTGHRSVAMVQRYIRHGSLFRVNPLEAVL